MKHLFYLFFVAVLFSCSSKTKGDLERNLTISYTPISYILEHPEEFGKGNTVTVKGTVISSSKIPLLGSKVVLEEDGKRIAVELEENSNVPQKGSEFVAEGYIKQGMKFEVAGYEYNGIVLKTIKGE